MNVSARALRLSLGLVALLATPSRAQQPTDVREMDFLEQYTETYRFTLGRPAAIQVAPDGAVFFLRSAPRSFVRELLVYDPVSRTERVLATASQLLRQGEETLTREERAQRERKRLAARGIATYALSRDGQRVLVPLSGRLFVLERTTGRIRELSPDSAGADAARFSPDGHRVALVRDGDLHVIDVASGRERRLTEREDEHVTHGLAEFVAQEEMDRLEGYWWSGDSRWIAYQRTDTRGVERLAIPDFTHPERGAESWPYPRAGRPNADVRLGVMPASGGPTTWVRWDSRRYPYLARVTWEENAPLTILVQNRVQTEEALLAVDPASGKTTTLLIEKDAAWLNLFDNAPAWLADGSGFLWSTERGGWPRLELRDRRGRLLRTITPPELNLRRVLHVDPARREAWVLGGQDPTVTWLYRVPLDGPGRMAPPNLPSDRLGFKPILEAGPVERCLTNAYFPEAGGDVRVVEVKTLEGAWRHDVIVNEQSQAGALRSVAEEPPYLPEVALERTRGAIGMNAAIVRPRAFQAGRRYPVVVHVYGGPMSQMVQADRRKYLIDQWVADQGFIVVCLDGRGTPARGRAWERALRGDLIGPVLADQVAGLEALAAVHPEMDLSRVGIWGWSYGGYVSAMAVMRRPDAFHVAMAGAPVTDWRQYDTHYTERYLGHPETNPAAYEKTSALAAAKDLRRPLLIVHGSNDDNVYFLHSLQLCDALNRAGREYEFVPLVGPTHMLSDAQTSRLLHVRLIHHLREGLAAVAPIGVAGTPPSP